MNNSEAIVFSCLDSRLGTHSSKSSDQVWWARGLKFEDAPRPVPYVKPRLSIRGLKADGEGLEDSLYVRVRRYPDDEAVSVIAITKRNKFLLAHTDFVS